MKKYIALFTLSFAIALVGCTKQSVKNRALALSIEKFDNEAQTEGKANFVDEAQQKIFTDFVKMNTVIDVDNVELQGDNEATARLMIQSFSKSVIPELKTISGKDWKAKIESAKEVKTYNLKLKKVDNAWSIVEQTEVPKN